MSRRIDTYAHRSAVQHEQPDGRPGRYYVSMCDGRRWALLYGPFTRHEDALAAVDMARQMALEADGYAHFYSFGTARAADEWLDSPPGVLNPFLPPLPADIPTEE